MLRYILFLSLITMSCTMDIEAIEESSKPKKEQGTPIRIVKESQFGMTSTSRTLTINSLVDPIPAVGPAHFLQLRGHCFRLRTEDYSYEFCPFYNVSQREISSRWNSYHGLLGVWSGWIFYNESDYVRGMRYSFGDKCGTSYKNATVVFECSEKNHSLHQAIESESCEFTLIFLTKLVCRDEWRAVFPYLEETYQEEWLQVQLENALGFLTEKGVYHEKREILKKVGWVHELNLTRLRESEAERLLEESRYDRSPYSHFMRQDVYESDQCQTELTASREKLSESQTLLQLINRTFQSGVSSNHSAVDIISSLSELLAPCNNTEDKHSTLLSQSVVSLDGHENTTHTPLTLSDSLMNASLERESSTELDMLEESVSDIEVDEG